MKTTRFAFVHWLHIGMLGFLGCAPCLETNQSPPLTQPAGLVKTSLERSRVDRALDHFHLAASKADADRYFGLLAPDAIFMGTDPSERWSVEEFRRYVTPYFSKGTGWTYTPSDRHVSFSKDGCYAWFDERLQSKVYGELRGSGVLRRDRGAWKIVFYNMMFPIPNEITQDIVQIIRNKTNKPIQDHKAP